MKTNRILSHLFLAVIALFLGLAMPVHAENPPMLDDARHDLEKAWNPGGDPPSVADRTALLKDALKCLSQAPSGHTSLYRAHLRAAREAINSALYELGKGDPDQKASDFIHTAVTAVRDIT